MISYFILIIFGLFTGVTSSLFGFGGGFIIVPLIYHMLPHTPYSMHVAVATSLAIMIINSVLATYRYNKNGDIRWDYNFPLAYYIGVGSIVGAYIATRLPTDIIRYMFLCYFLVVILHCFLKKEFIHQNDGKLKTLTNKLNIIVGIFIGAIASSLGVGGSVMTVPLMRKLGLSMKQSAALANPLSLPIAFVGAVTYVFLSIHDKINLGTDYLGLVYLPGLIVLSICGVIGVPIGTLLANKIGNKFHAQGFVVLLVIAFVTMLF